MTLRPLVIEAMAKAWVAYEGDEWDDINSRGMAAIRACVERELDATLSVLSEHADEWASKQSAKYPLAAVRGVDVRRLLAVLADPEEEM